MNQPHISQILQYFGLDENDKQLFLLVYQYGPKPASHLAKMIGLERTHVYKLLKKMVGMGIITETQSNKTKQFFVSDISVLQNIFDKKHKELEYIGKNLTNAEEELKGLKQNNTSFVPKISIYDGYNGIQNIFEDMTKNISDCGFRMVKFFGSNTVESQTETVHNLQDYAKDFFEFCKKKQVGFDSYIGNGILLMEMLNKVQEKDLQKLPAGQDAINVFIIGTTVYIIIYKTIPFGIKIKNNEIVDMLNLFWKQFGK